MRAADAHAIEKAGVPSLDLMERAGIGLARVTAAAARPGPIRVVWGRATTAATGWWWRGCCARRGARSTC